MKRRTISRKPRKVRDEISDERREEVIRDGYDDLDEDEKVELYNEFAEANKYEQAFKKSEIDDYFSVSNEDSYKSAYDFYEAVAELSDNDYVTTGVYGLEPFNEEDIDKYYKEDIINAMINDEIYLPKDIQDNLDMAEDDD